MKKVLLLLALFFCVQHNAGAITIAEARQTPLGETVTVQGVVTHGSSLGIIRYLQDETGGIAAYPGSGSAAGFADNTTQGDLVEVTGVLKEYNGLLEIDPIDSYEVISSGNELPAPLMVDATGVNEENEALLLRLEGINFVDGGSDFTSGTYNFTDGDGNESQIYLRSGHPWIGTQVPLAPVNITGISSQFSAQYQLLPRDLDDLEIATSFFINSSITQSDLTTDGFTLSWSTNTNGSSAVNYGLTPDLELGQITGTGNTTSHTVDLSGLDPATFYYVQVVSNDGSNDAVSNVILVSTQSNSTGQMDVYFNKSVDPNFATTGNEANYYNPAAVQNLIVDYIDNAQTSIDVCFYNNNREAIVTALNNAVDRGVQVRYVYALSTANLALADNAADFPTLGANGEHLMHNKFMIFDVDSEDDSYVLSGSLNLTDVNFLDDANNVILIQDQALARAYKLEFEEMWGGDSPDPNIFSASSGSGKVTNTPQLFNIGGVMTELYFSPTDNTTNRIIDAIESSDTDLQIAILSFTKNEIGTAVANAFNDDVSVRGIMENTGDQGSEFDFLVNTVGVDFVQGSTSGQIHHKYCIIDATNAGSDPQVVTGSHNWSNGAENNNDENTLIIHSADIANIYLQEFEQRWCEIAGGDCYPDDGGFTNVQPIEQLGINVYPNPTTDFINVEFDNALTQNAVVSIYNVEGKLVLGSKINTDNNNIYVGMLASGIYQVYIQQGETVALAKLIKQ